MIEWYTGLDQSIFSSNGQLFNLHQPYYQSLLEHTSVELDNWNEL